MSHDKDEQITDSIAFFVAVIHIVTLNFLAFVLNFSLLSCLNKVLFAKRERKREQLPIAAFLSFHSSVFDTSQSVQAVLWVHVARGSHTYTVADILLFLSNNSSLPFNSSFSLSYFCSFLLLKSIFQLKKEKSL